MNWKNSYGSPVNVEKTQFHFKIATELKQIDKRTAFFLQDSTHVELKISFQTHAEKKIVWEQFSLKQIRNFNFFFF